MIGLEHGGDDVGGGRRFVAELELGDRTDQIVARVGATLFEQRVDECHQLVERSTCVDPCDRIPTDASLESPVRLGEDRDDRRVGGRGRHPRGRAAAGRRGRRRGRRCHPLPTGRRRSPRCSASDANRSVELGPPAPEPGSRDPARSSRRRAASAFERVSKLASSANIEVTSSYRVIQNRLPFQSR